MNNDIYIIGEIGWDYDLKSLIDSVDRSDRTKPLNVHIHSVGGAVYEGLAMYNYLKNLEQEVHTSSAGLVASIASIIFLAGKKETRKINRTDNFLIHLPMGGSQGNAKDLEKTAEELRDIEGKASDIYSAETNLTPEEALTLMEGDKFLDVDFLKEKGFVNEIIEFKAVAKLGNKQIDKMEKQVTKNEVEGWFSEFKAKYFPGKDEPTNKIVTDATGLEIDFTELEADATPANGDTAEVDGAKASGEYLMPSGETFKFTEGVLEIMPVVEENEDLEAANAEIEDLKAKLSASETAKAEQETLVASKETELTNVKQGLKDFKAEVTSSFEYTNLKKKDETGQEEEGRSLFKKD